MLPIQYAPQFVLRPFFATLDTLGYPDSDSEACRWLQHQHYNRFYSAGGHAYRDCGTHSFSRLVPGNLFKEHPGMFPMYTDKKWEPELKKKGLKLNERVPYRSVGSMGTSFCTTSPKAREYIVKTMVEKLKKNPQPHRTTTNRAHGK